MIKVIDTSTNTVVGEYERPKEAKMRVLKLVREHPDRDYVIE